MKNETISIHVVEVNPKTFYTMLKSETYNWHTSDGKDYEVDDIIVFTVLNAGNVNNPMHSISFSPSRVILMLTDVDGIEQLSMARDVKYNMRHSEGIARVIETYVKTCKKNSIS